jgi:hypothetical protein
MTIHAEIKNIDYDLYLSLKQQIKKERIKRTQHKYYVNHKQLKKDLATDYNKKNYEMHKLNVKNYYIRHNERLSAKNILCCCGKLISKKSTHMHNKTLKHLKFIDQQQQQEHEQE